MDDDVLAAVELIQRRLHASAEKSRVTIADLWEPYAAWARLNLDTWTTVEGRWRRHLRQFFGGMRAGDVGFAEIDRYQAMRAEEKGHNRKTLTRPATRNREIETVIRLLNFGIERKLITTHQFIGVSKNRIYEKERNVRRTIVSAGQLNSVLEFASPMMRAIFLTARDTGMRREEVVILRKDQIDRQNMLIHLDAVDTKTDEGRTTMLTPRSLAAIDALPATPLSPWVFTTTSPRRPNHHYEKTYITAAWRKVCLKAGVIGPDGDIWLHDNRRTWITKARRTGLDTQDIRKMSGHKTEAAFVRYSIVSVEDVKRARAIIQADIDGEEERARRPAEPPDASTASPATEQPAATRPDAAAPQPEGDRVGPARAPRRAQEPAPERVAKKSGTTL